MAEGYELEVPARGMEYLGDQVRRRREFPRQEVEAAIKRYFELANQCAASGNWNPWADLFTEDAIYIEHSFGVIRGGREGIRKWVMGATKGLPTDMRMGLEWFMIDGDRCMFYCPNRWPAPDGGKPFRYAMVSIMAYAGDGQWCYEEDIANTHEQAWVHEAWSKAKAPG